MALQARIQFGVDLVDQAIYHITFLKAVHNNNQLRKPEVLKHALYRYEKFWLPLAAEHPREYLSAPMDIEWVWHCHMLSPKAYESDCRNIVRVTVNHTILRPDEFQRSRDKARAYWSEKYSEPFYIDYDAINDKNKDFDFLSQISYDILTAAERQRTFLYQVSLPHYLDRQFLESALARYKQLLLLKRQHPEELLVPCYDIDLIWHTHRLNPIIYKNDTLRIVGQLSNYDDSVNERHEGSKLNNADKRTKKLWKQVYNESFSKSGTLFRGSPPAGFLYSITEEDKFSFCTKLCVLSLDQLTLHLPSPDLNRSKHFDLKASSAKVSRKEVAKWFKLKRPANSRPGNPSIVWSKVGSFNFDTSSEHGILFSIQQKSGMLSTKTELDTNFLDIIPLIESPANAKKPGGLLKRKLTFKANITLDIHGHFQQPKSGEAYLNLEEGSYTDDVIPTDLQKLCGPVAFESLSSGSDKRCKVALHTLKNHLGHAAFQVRTIHSTSLMTSVIQVLFKDKLCSVAHLVTADQFPLPTQVSPDMVTLNPRLGERAVLIKNENGDWGIVFGHWAGLKKAVPPSRGRTGVLGSPGTLRLKFYKMSTGEVIHTALAYAFDQYSISIESTKVDLEKGIMQINSQSNEVTENISLVFAISLLHVLCVPRPKDWKEGTHVSVTMNRGTQPMEAIPSDSMSCVRAAGLFINTPSNHFIASSFGGRFCATCLGSNEGHDEHSDIENEWCHSFGVDSDETGYENDADGAGAGSDGCEGGISGNREARGGGDVGGDVGGGGLYGGSDGGDKGGSDGGDGGGGDDADGGGDDGDGVGDGGDGGGGDVGHGDGNDGDGGGDGGDGGVGNDVDGGEGGGDDGDSGGDGGDGVGGDCGGASCGGCDVCGTRL